MAAGAIAQAVDVGRSMGMPKRVILGGRGEGSSRKDGEDHGEDGERDEQSMHASLHRHLWRNLKSYPRIPTRIPN